MSDPTPNLSQSGPGNPAEGDQYREYYIPARCIVDEQELLQEYQTDKLITVLEEIYNEFYLMIELMRGYAENNDDDDFTYFLLAQRLQKPLDRLSFACSTIVDWELVCRRTIGTAAP